MITRTFKPFEKKIWLSSPTMHGDELTYMKQAFDTNWMSTVGENIPKRRWCNVRLCDVGGS